MGPNAKARGEVRGCTECIFEWFDCCCCCFEKMDWVFPCMTGGLMNIFDYYERFNDYHKLTIEEQINTVSKVKSSKPVTVQPPSSASMPPTQTMAAAPTPIEKLSPTLLKEANHMLIDPSHPQQIRDTPPTQVTVRIPDETPTQIPALNLQPVPPPRIPLDTENTAPYPVSKLPYPTDSPHKIPIAGQF